MTTQRANDLSATERVRKHGAMTLRSIGNVARRQRLVDNSNFSVPSMTALVIWPGATSRQIQDEVLNRIEKKFEQLDRR